MLRNALPAEKPAALGTSGHRFAQLMMVTALVCQVWHRAFNNKRSQVQSSPFRVVLKDEPRTLNPRIEHRIMVPDFDTAYAGARGTPVVPAVDAILATLPPP